MRAIIMARQQNTIKWRLAGGPMMAQPQAFDSPCINRKNPKLLVFTRFPVLVMPPPNFIPFVLTYLGSFDLGMSLLQTMAGCLRMAEL